MTERIDDHADRAVELLPSQHDRPEWARLLRALLGLRGTWVDDEVLWATMTTTKGMVVVPDGELAFWFAGDAGMITGPGYTEYDLGDGKLLRARIIPQDSPIPAFAQSAETIDAALAAHDILPLTHDELLAQVVAEVTAKLAIAPWSLQEVEGVVWELAFLRALETAAGLQLDGVGDILHLTRDGQSDADYRAALRIARRANRSRGTVPEILEAADEQTEVVFAQLQNEMDAYYTLYLHGTTLDQRRRRLLRAMRASGIGTDIFSAGGTLPFVFGPDSGWNRIDGVAGDVFDMEGDVSGSYAIGDAVRVFDYSTGLVVHETTVTSVTFVGPNTDIGVDDDGGVSGTNQILENATRGIQDEDGGPFEDSYVITGFSGLNTFQFTGDGSAQFEFAQLIEVVGSSGDDGFYRVLTSSFGGGQTSLTVFPDPPVGAGDGQLQHVISERAPALIGSSSLHGEFADVFVD